MFKKCFSVVLTVWVLCACNSSLSTLQTYSIDVKQRDSLSCFFSGYDYVMLATNEDILLGDAENMKVDSSVIAVQDKGRVFLFRHDGKFITKIDKLGRGAGEYLSVEDFCIRDSLIFILSRAQKRISVYDWNAAFVRKIDLDDWYQHFKILDDRLMLLSSESCNEKGYDFVMFNYAESEYLAVYSPFEINEGIVFDGFTPFCGTYDGGYYLIRPFDYTVYRLGVSSFEPYCSFDFNTSEHFEQGESFVDLSSKTSNKNVVKYLGLYEEYDESVYLTFKLFEDRQGIGTYVCKVEANGKVCLMRMKEKFSDEFPYMSSPFGVYDGSLYSICSASQVLNIEDMYDLSLFHDKGLTEDSNHVVFFHKLR